MSSAIETLQIDILTRRNGRPEFAVITKTVVFPHVGVTPDGPVNVGEVRIGYTDDGRVSTVTIASATDGHGETMGRAYDDHGFLKSVSVRRLSGVRWFPPVLWELVNSILQEGQAVR